MTASDRVKYVPGVGWFFQQDTGNWINQRGQTYTDLDMFGGVVDCAVIRIQSVDHGQAHTGGDVDLLGEVDDEVFESEHPNHYEMVPSWDDDELRRLNILMLRKFVERQRRRANALPTREVP